MLFNSVVFIFAFLPVAWAGYFLLGWMEARRAGGRGAGARAGLWAKAWLVGASLFFYGYWDPSFLPLILFSVGFNYLLGRRLRRNTERVGERHGMLTFGVVVNLGLLGGFKYTAFFAETANFVFEAGLNVPSLVLPLAISFFTFQQIAYLVDSARGRVAADTSAPGSGVLDDFVSYALFVTFFPQLIAGPIVHHARVIPQFRNGAARHPLANNIALGLIVFGFGLFKKVVVADSFAPLVDAGFAGAQGLGFWEAWTAALGYSVQLYYDFSGYSDMAVGLALLFNIRLPFNFDSPYKARSIREFWRRWHITLSEFLRDYLYIPLGGNRVAEWRVNANLLLTFLLGGLWHGAGWTFVVWGGLHGAALVAHRAWVRLGGRMPAMAGWALTLLFVVFTWVFFRANTLQDALAMSRAMVDLSPDNLALPWGTLDALGHWTDRPLHATWAWRDGMAAASPMALPLVLAALAFAATAPNTNRFRDGVASRGWLLVAGVLFGVAVAALFASSSSVFLYFDF